MANKMIASFPGKDVKKCQLGIKNNPNNKFVSNLNLLKNWLKEINNNIKPIEEKNPKNINIEK